MFHSVTVIKQKNYFFRIVKQVGCSKGDNEFLIERAL
jgi:hypothetical protein